MPGDDAAPSAERPDAVTPFQVDVPNAVLQDLHERLWRTRWPDQLPGTGWAYGTNLEYLRELCDYWRSSFDWRAAEARLNRFPQFTTTVEGQRVHFVHARSPEPDALPLVITHGWPGSVAELLDVVGPLSDPVAYGGDARDAFHVVAPSIPGYGFSGPTTVPGYDARHVAAAVASVMARLGYDRYGAQGGDWGSVVTTILAGADAAHVVGIHLNLLVAFPPDLADPLAGLSEPTQTTSPPRGGSGGTRPAISASKGRSPRPSPTG